MFHILQLPSSVSPFASFHDLVSTICSNTVIIVAVFPGLRFWDNNTWHFCSYPLYNLHSYSFTRTPLLFDSSLPFSTFPSIPSTLASILYQSALHLFKCCLPQIGSLLQCHPLPYCFFYYRILLLGVLSFPSSADPLVFWPGHVASDSQPRLFVDVFQWLYSPSTIFSSKVQSLIAWLLP